MRDLTGVPGQRLTSSVMGGLAGTWRDAVTQAGWPSEDILFGAGEVLPLTNAAVLAAEGP